MAGLALMLLIGGVAPAAADIRRIGLTSFDRIEISGDMTVDVRADWRVGAVAEGSRDALDTLELVVENRVLRIRQLAMGTFGPRRADAGQVRIRVTAQNLQSLAVNGGAAVTVEGLGGRAAALWLNGPGTLNVTRITAEALSLRAQGNGAMTLSGRTDSLNANINGGTRVDAAALTAQRLTVTAIGTSTSHFAAIQTAEVNAGGTGSITVSGTPRCTVRNVSAGTVQCGRAAASPRG